VGADIDGKDVTRRDTESLELEAAGGAQVKQRLADTAARRTEEGIGKAGFLEGGAHVLADFVTLAADAGSESRQDSGRIGSMSLFHPPDDFLQDAPRYPFPAAVDRSNDTFFLIDKEDRQAVGRPDDKQKTGPVCDRGIAPKSPSRRLVNKMDNIGVHLVKEDGF